jgi:predicted nucleotidyltransferase component of viral defense system
MINKQELLTFAKEYNLPAITIEKDYVLNWVLDGIANSDLFKDNWIFKGGTCLKKCYFEQYRFSEDLDFTISDPTHINTTLLIKEFQKISNWVYEESGIEIPEDNIEFEEYINPRGTISITGKVPFKGPMKRRGSIPTIKLDLTNDEIIVNQPELKSIHHPYSDTKPMQIFSYGIHEIFAEKFRALVERLRPRDLYDIIHLHTDKRWKPSSKAVKDTLIKKCRYKNVSVPSMEELESSPHKQDLINDWQDMLAHQITDLQPFNFYWEKLPIVFDWLYNNKK